MRFSIIGVGQTFNLTTKQMDDTLQVATPSGVVSIPTTNEAAQMLITMAMNGGGSPPPPSNGYRPPEPDPGPSWEEEMSLSRPVESGEDFPEGAMVFGGPEGEEEMADSPYPAESTGNLSGVADPPKQQLFKKTVATDQPRKQNNADRSGVPSYGLARVDEKGNPVLPAPPDMTMDDEEDPGEQI